MKHVGTDRGAALLEAVFALGILALSLLWVAGLLALDRQLQRRLEARAGVRSALEAVAQGVRRGWLPASGSDLGSSPLGDLAAPGVGVRWSSQAWGQPGLSRLLVVATPAGGGPAQTLETYWWVEP